MSKLRLEFIREARGEAYCELLGVALALGGTALLIERQSLGLGQRALAVIDQLAPALLEVKTQSEWPGTQLLADDAAIARYYRLDGHATEVLKRAANALYDWAQPELPEDLCVLAPDGTPFLVSISHEKDAYLLVNDAEESLVRQAPGLAGLIAED